MNRTQQAEATGTERTAGIGESTLKRRGLIAGVAALAAAALVKQNSEQVAAITLQPLLIGTTNDADLVINPFVTTSLAGTVTNGLIAPTNTAPVFVVTQRAAASGSAIQGTNNGTGPGVVGYSPSGMGVYGASATSIGVYGVNLGGGFPYGVAGAAVGGTGFGVYGVATTAGSAAFAGGTTVAGGIAGQFGGDVNIYDGNVAIATSTGPKSFVCGPGVSKNAAVPLPDGSHGLMHCVEAPEPWFEDFGEATITAGKADVKLDPNFAGVVDTSTLHVFFTSQDTSHTLHLTGRSGSGFSVSASPTANAAAAGKKTTDLAGTFTWRVVAKRKDVKADRFARFAFPKKIPTPVPPLPTAIAK